MENIRQKHKIISKSKFSQHNNETINENGRNKPKELSSRTSPEGEDKRKSSSEAKSMRLRRQKRRSWSLPTASMEIDLEEMMICRNRIERFRRSKAERERREVLEREKEGF